MLGGKKKLSDDDKSIGEYFSKYFAHWPVFITSLILCIGTGVFYTRYTPPKFIAYTSFLIKGIGENETATGSNDLIESALNGKREVNLNNELIIIRSSDLMQRVVAKNGYNINYYYQGNILKTDIYHSVPFRLVPKNTQNDAFVRLKIYKLNSSGGKGIYKTAEEKEFLFKWNTPFIAGGKTFVLSPNSKDANFNGNYEVTWETVESAAAKISDNLTVRAYDPKTSVIHLSLLTENLEKGKDLLNALYNEYNLADIENRNKISETTVKFIDERLNEISSELKGVEGNLEVYRGNNRLLDVSGQSSQSLEASNDANRLIKDLNVKQSVVTIISKFFSNPSNNGKLVPSSLGVDDPVLTGLITQYNELQLKKDREAASVAENSLIMQDFNNQLSNIRGSILESLGSVSKNLQLQEGTFQQQKNQHTQFLSSLPHNERVLQEIRRKQSITEGLYLYLLQKREEAAISSTSLSVSNYKQIDLAKGYGPVEPNKKNILLYAIVLGLAMPIAWIYFKGLFNNKVSSREDIIRNTFIPVIGDIGHVSKKKNKIVVPGNRDLLGEQLRIIRASLSLLNKSSQIILVTSTIGNEGKSFVAINVAAVLSIPGKKVALIQFDMRKPGATESVGPQNENGIAQYLSNKINDLEDIYHFTEELPNLHVYPPGLVIGNPADLLLSKRMDQLFAELKQQYDYIVVDSAPASLFSDAFILTEYSQAVLYIIRQRYTLKKQINFLNDIYDNKKIENVGIILNDIRVGIKHGYEGYGYKTKNGYYHKENSNNYKPFKWINRKELLKSITRN